MVKIVKEAECMKVYAEEEAITYQRKMMTAIPWLLPFEWSGEKELFYQKGQGLNLIQWLKSEKSEESILEVIDAFFQNYKEADAYLIDEEKMILDPEWIFWEETKKRSLGYVEWKWKLFYQTVFFVAMVCSIGTKMAKRKADFDIISNANCSQTSKSASAVVQMARKRKK